MSIKPTDEALINRLEADEGYRQFPYECTAGKQTIGIGRNIDDVGIRHDEAHMLCVSDCGIAMVYLDQHESWWRLLNDERQRVCTEMVFQLGGAGFSAFRKMIAAMKVADWETAAAEALDSKWAREDSPERAARAAERIRTGEPG